MRRPREQRRIVQGEIDEEIAFHLDEAARDRVAAGMTEAEAHANAALDFGDVTRIRTACERQRLWGDHMMQRFHVTLTLFLALCTGFLAIQWGRDLGARQAQIEALEARIQMLTPAQAVESTRADFGRYAVGDTIAVVDVKQPDRLNLTQTIRADGTILMPDVGWVQAAELTRAELSAKLNEQLQAYYVDAPQIEIVLQESAPHRVPPVPNVIVAVGNRLRYADPIRPQEWSGEARVEADGTCLFPVVGRLSVAGLTRSELESLVRSRMKTFFRDGSEATFDVVKGDR